VNIATGVHDHCPGCELTVLLLVKQYGDTEENIWNCVKVMEE